MVVSATNFINYSYLFSFVFLFWTFPWRGYGSLFLRQFHSCSQTFSSYDMLRIASDPLKYLHLGKEMFIINKKNTAVEFITQFKSYTQIYIFSTKVKRCSIKFSWVHNFSTWVSNSWTPRTALISGNATFMSGCSQEHPDLNFFIFYIYIYNN